MTIKIGYPVDLRSHRKTQGFGENPQDYARFGLKGHNGDDFASVNVGQTDYIFAVDQGTVSKVAYDLNGFGHHVYVQHGWGKSVYAHMVKIWVTVGDKVARGTILGEEGSTGNSSGKHVHFGIYPTGISVNNGYKGAVDPTPYYVMGSDAGPSEPEKPEKPAGELLKAGKAMVVSNAGLNVRLSPSKQNGKLLAWLQSGAVIDITDQTAQDGDVVYRAAIVWVAETEGNYIYLKNVE